jgi:hypothetical protein
MTRDQGIFQRSSKRKRNCLQGKTRWLGIVHSVWLFFVSLLNFDYLRLGLKYSGAEDICKNEKKVSKSNETKQGHVSRKEREQPIFFQTILFSPNPGVFVPHKLRAVCVICIVLELSTAEVCKKNFQITRTDTSKDTNDR